MHDEDVLRRPGVRPLIGPRRVAAWLAGETTSPEERLLFAGARLRVIGLAMWVGWASLIAVFAATMLHTVHDERLHHWHIWLLLAAAVLFHVTMYLIPWRRLVTARASELLLYAWAGAIVVFVGLLLYMAGPYSSDFYLVYLLLVLFAAAAFPRSIYYPIVAIVAVSYVAIASISVSPRDLTVRVAAILLVAAMAGHLAREQRSMARNVARLHEAMVTVAAERDLPALRAAVASWARRLTDAEATVLVAPDGGEAVRDPPDAEVDLSGLHLEEAVAEGRPVVRGVAEGRTAVHVVPLDGGALVVYGAPEGFITAHQYLLETLAAQAAVTMQTARLHEGLRVKERARAALLRELVRAQEEERRRIARELHDGTSQDLAGLVVGLEALEATDPGRSAVDTGELKRLARSATEDLRRLILDLRPRALDDLGLAAALRWLAHERHADLHVDLDVDPRLRLTPPLDTAVFRIVQEALANVERHSNATRARVGVALENGVIRAVVEDKGEGFDPGARTGGLGILGMRERAEQLGGTLVITSGPGNGTRVELELPLGT